MCMLFGNFEWESYKNTKHFAQGDVIKKISDAIEKYEELAGLSN